MKILAQVTVAVVLSACGVAAEDDSAGRQPAVHDDLVEVLDVRCDDGDLHLGSNRVRTHPDGVHVHVRELPDDGTTVELTNVDPPDAPMGGGGRGGAYEVGIAVLNMVAPGPVLVRCYPDAGPRHFLSAHEDADSVVVEVVDEVGHWRWPDGGACDSMVSGTIFDYGVGGLPDVDEREQLGQLDQAAAMHLGLAPEAVQTFGYEQGTWRWAGVVQDGKLEALASFENVGGIWRVQTSSRCE